MEEQLAMFQLGETMAKKTKSFQSFSWVEMIIDDPSGNHFAGAVRWCPPLDKLQNKLSLGFKVNYL